MEELDDNQTFESEESKEKRKGGLTEKQQAAINLIIAGSYYKDIAEQLGVHEGTLKKWRSQKLFAGELNRRKKEVMKTAHGILMGNTTKAMQQLVELMDDPKPDRNKIALLRWMYEEGKTAAIEDYEDRIEKLEDAINTQV